MVGLMNIFERNALGIVFLISIACRSCLTSCIVKVGHSVHGKTSTFWLSQFIAGMCYDCVAIHLTASLDVADYGKSYEATGDLQTWQRICMAKDT